MSNTIEKLIKRKETLVQYLIMKTQEEDWHGVSDAANDIRVIESAINTYKEMGQ